VFFRTYSPQGDGNNCDLVACNCEKSNVFQNLFPARGRKRFRNLLLKRICVFASFSEPIPRKGTETADLVIAQDDYKGCFSEPIPRKGTETTLVASILLLVVHTSFSEPIPRKGTETLPCQKPLGLPLAWFFRTYSPQGDGNPVDHLHIVRSYIRVFQNLFPARGRKL